MSNLATASRLRAAASQFPASWYCDPRLFELERRVLFPRAPGYVGHELMVPEAGDYYTLPARDNAQVLVRNAGGIELKTTVLPFILRGVRLIGVDTGYTPMPLRRKVWGRLATDLKPKHLAAIAHTIALADVPAYCTRMLEGQIRGRAVVTLDR